MIPGEWLVDIMSISCIFGEYESPGRKLCDYVYLRLVWSSSMHVQCRTMSVNCELG